jgi:hypothetical protein
VVGEDVKVGPGAGVEALAVGKVMVMPAEPQYCCANARVAIELLVSLGYESESIQARTSLISGIASSADA